MTSFYLCGFHRLIISIKSDSIKKTFKIDRNLVTTAIFLMETSQRDRIMRLGWSEKWYRWSGLLILDLLWGS
jgi:hypothetical protein